MISNVRPGARWLGSSMELLRRFTSEGSLHGRRIRSNGR
jgi:hypothetical protein